MKTKLRNLFTAKTVSACRNTHWLTPMFVILLALGGVSELLASDLNTNSTTNLEEFNPPQIVKSYTITDASTVDKDCFPTKGEGVIFQRADGCEGLHHIWSVKDELTFNEYDNNTATIVGSVIDNLGKIGYVNIELFNKSNKGNTWNASCYVDGITDPRTLYQDFSGTITVDGHAYTVEPKVYEQHYIVADGAGFEPGQFGFGAWTAGTFGGCTEWFGNLEEIPVPCDVTANAGNDISISFGGSTTLTATGGSNYIWSTGETTASITVSPTETTTYAVMLTSDIGECTDADQVVVTVDCAMEVDLGDDLLFCEETETVLTANVTNIPTYTKVIASYNITDADTSTGICANVHGNEQGVILQKNNPDFPVTSGNYNAWKVYKSLVLNEYDNQTAKITGNVIDENGNIGIVDVLLYDKQNQGKSWSAECYLNGLVGPQLFYQSFHGTIIVADEIYTVEPKKSGHHFVLAEGASLEPNQFGFGAWTSGTWGIGGEWFGNLDPIEIENCETVSYLWSTGETTASITVSEAGEYSVTVKNCNDCEATDSVKIEVLDVKADAGDDVTICLGDTTTLEVEGEGTYLWSNGATTKTIQVSPEATSTYSVTVTNSECKAEDEVVVTVENATANIGNDLTICFGDSTTLQVEGEGTYLWSNGATTQSIEVRPEVTTTYSVTVTNGQCEATDDMTVTVENATADVGNDQTICLGDTTTLKVNGEGTYLWSNGATTQSIEVSPETTTAYSVTVTNGQCEATDDMTVTVENATADAGDNATICFGETTTLAVEGKGTYLWSTGATTQSIEVSPEATTTYSVTVTNGQCEATDEVVITVENKIVIGDYVWLDENRNGLQDDGATGVNDISVKLYQCTTGDFIEVTKTQDGANGAGYYEFEVCQNSGEYYIVFGDVPSELEFTTNVTNDALNDSNADVDGRTSCFTIAEEDDLTIDAGLNEVCDLNVDAGEEAEICVNANSTVELTATIEDGTDECPGGCVYPVIEQDRCFGPTGDFEIWLNSKGGLSSWAFKASEQRFEVLANGNAKYTATASNGVDTIEMDVTFSGYTTTPTLGSPKLNECQDYDTTDWEYWTTWTGTITSENHGIYTMSMMGAPFQMGVGADVTRTGFGASGWFSTEGGDGYYTIGDVNIPLAECQENGVEFKWTTQDGNIVSNPYKKTISVDTPGTYVFEAMNCIDCFSTDKVVVAPINCGKTTAENVKKISKVYPVPVISGGTLTVEFGKETTGTTSKKAFGPQLEEDVNMVVYDMNGRMISVPRTFKMVNGKATIHLDIDSIPSGKYIVRAQGLNWAESKHIVVK